MKLGAAWAVHLPIGEVSAQSSAKLRPDVERLTVESAICHLKRLEIRQSTPFRRDSTSEFDVVPVAKVVAKVEHFE